MFLYIGDRESILKNNYYDGKKRYQVSSSPFVELEETFLLELKDSQKHKFNLEHNFIKVTPIKIKVSSMGFLNVKKETGFMVGLRVVACGVGQKEFPDTKRIIIASGDIGEGFDIKTYLFGSMGRHYTIIKNEITFKLRDLNVDSSRVITPSLETPTKGRYPSGSYLTDALRTKKSLV